MTGAGTLAAAAALTGPQAFAARPRKALPDKRFTYKITRGHPSLLD